MRTSKNLTLLTCAVAAAFTLAGAEAPTLDPHLEPLRPLLGKTWRGEFANSRPDHPTVDVSRWERALNGKAVRMLHSINDGVYGGETIFTWDAAKQTVAYHYFTTAGFNTVGTLTVADGKIITREEIVGEAGGVTQVRGTSEIRSDGSFHVKSEHLKNGEWVTGHKVTYHEASDAKVIFK